MNRGLFEAQLNAAAMLLKRLQLLHERNYFPNYRNYGASILAHEPYRRIWEICYSEQFYDFILLDYSLLIFRVNFEAYEFHYAYYESPQQVITYENFLVQDCGFIEDDLEDIGDYFRADYEQALITMGLKEVVTPVRYDYEPRIYSPGIHSASHMHFGHNSSIRLGTKLILKPISFLLFVCRQCYPDSWIQLQKVDMDYTLRNNVRVHLDQVSSDLWGSEDNWELILS